MQLAIIEDNQIISVGYYKDLFPNVSFPSTGADAEFMNLNNCFEVSAWKPTTDVQKLISVAPYIEGNQVFIVQVVDKTPEEITIEYESKKAKQVVSMRQARIALSRQGLLEQVTTLISSLDEESKITWEYAIEVRRNDNLVSSLATAMNLSDTQLDELFTLAATV